jgi:hypothetical protein
MLLDDPGVLAAFVTAFVGGFFLICATWLQTRKTKQEAVAARELAAVVRVENEEQHGRAAELLHHLATEVTALVERADGGFERIEVRMDDQDGRITELEMHRLTELLGPSQNVDASTTVILEPPHE